MHDTGSKSSDGCQFFRARHGSIGFDACRDVFADGNHVCHIVAAVGPHGNLAHLPMPRLAFGSRGFLLDALNAAGIEDVGEFPFKQLAFLARQHVIDIAAHHRVARQTQLA